MMDGGIIRKSLLKMVFVQPNNTSKDCRDKEIGMKEKKHAMDVYKENQRRAKTKKRIGMLLNKREELSLTGRWFFSFCVTESAMNVIADLKNNGTDVSELVNKYFLEFDKNNS